LKGRSKERDNQHLPHKDQVANSRKPFPDLLTKVQGKNDEGLRLGSTLNRIHYYIEMREYEYTYILGALAKIHSGTLERCKQTRRDSTYAAGC
jgi:hypothetical protein